MFSLRALFSRRPMVALEVHNRADGRVYYVSVRADRAADMRAMLKPGALMIREHQAVAAEDIMAIKG